MSALRRMGRQQLAASHLEKSHAASMPLCGECSNRWGEAVPVEKVRMEMNRPKRVIASAECTVIAWCSHTGRPSNRGDKQHATFAVPHWWGDAHVSDAIADLVFFVPGETKPEHSLVTDIT